MIPRLWRENRVRACARRLRIYARRLRCAFRGHQLGAIQQRVEIEYWRLSNYCTRCDFVHVTLIPHGTITAALVQQYRLTADEAAQKASVQERKN